MIRIDCPDYLVLSEAFRGRILRNNNHLEIYLHMQGFGRVYPESQRWEIDNQNGYICHITTYYVPRELRGELRLSDQPLQVICRAWDHEWFIRPTYS